MLGQRSLNPGESIDMAIHYNTFKYPGKFDKTVHIFTGPDGKTEEVIHVVGFVSAMPMGILEVMPRKAVVEGLAFGKTTRTSVLLKNSGDAPLTIRSIKSPKFGLTYWEGTLTIEAGKSVPVEIGVTPQETGRFMDIIMIYSDARNDIGKGYKAVLVGTAQ